MKRIDSLNNFLRGFSQSRLRSTSSSPTVTHIVFPSPELEEDYPHKWRPNSGPYGPLTLGDPPKSIPIWAWGLLKTAPRSIDELAAELRCHPNSIHNAIWQLRKRGHKIVLWRREYHLLDGPPLEVQECPTGLRLTPVPGASTRKIKRLTEIP